MFKNYLKITLRNLRKHKVYSLINISGLAIGMACCILILLFVSDELSYDRFHEKRDRIYRLNAISSIGSTSRHYAHTPPIVATGLTESLPEIESSVRLFAEIELEGRLDEENIRIPEVWFVDPTFFDIFSYKFVSGDAQKAFAEPDSLVIMQETALRLFSDGDALGKVVSLPPDRSLRISGVIQDVPKNSHFQFQGLIPSTWLRDREGRPAPVLTADYFCEVYAYLLLREGTDIEKLQEKIAITVKSKWGEIYKQRGTSRQYPLIHLQDIHLRSGWNTSWVSLAISIPFIFFPQSLCWSCLSLVSILSTFLPPVQPAGPVRSASARSLVHRRSQLVRQFLSESVAVSLISLFLGLSLVTTVLPLSNKLSGKQFGYDQLLKLPVLLGLLGIIILTGLDRRQLSGFYPLRLPPIMVLKGRFSSASKNSLLRKTLVMVQFAISVFLDRGDPDHDQAA